jgi:hypothetical protein
MLGLLLKCGLILELSGYYSIGNGRNESKTKETGALFPGLEPKSCLKRAFSRRENAIAAPPQVFL